MSIKVEGAIRIKDLSAGEQDFVAAIKEAVKVAVDKDVNPNHILSMLSGLFVKTALAFGVPLSGLDDLVEGVRLTIESEREHAKEGSDAEAN